MQSIQLSKLRAGRRMFTLTIPNTGVFELKARVWRLQFCTSLT